MRGRWLALVGALVSLVTWWACAPEVEREGLLCNADEPCDKGFVCDNGRCQLPATDASGLTLAADGAPTLRLLDDGSFALQHQGARLWLAACQRPDAWVALSQEGNMVRLTCEVDGEVDETVRVDLLRWEQVERVRQRPAAERAQ